MWLAKTVKHPEPSVPFRYVPFWVLAPRLDHVCVRHCVLFPCTQQGEHHA